MIRLEVSIRGVVQGVGFRPFVHAAATRRGLSGWVRNGAEGVRIEVQGYAGAVREFVDALRDGDGAPAAARIEHLATAELPVRTEAGFTIVESRLDAAVEPSLPPDMATCPACIAEVDAPGRRRGYPFTSCSVCGPRFTIIERLPYDRGNTTMAGFGMCADCRREYESPDDRRFHAQPIACPACGPALRLVSAEGAELDAREEALEQGVSLILEGRILALQGLGGFQLLADASSPGAVARLRERKRREEKPFAVLFAGLAEVVRECVLGSGEEALLVSPAAPIVLLRRRPGGSVAGNVAPRNPLLGAMLPSTPLHALIARRAARPLVCTSGNLSGEPMAVSEDEARARLGAVAEAFLVHDRPIARPVDDSVSRLGPTGPQVLRRARGYAPLPHPFPDGPCILALGGQEKSTVALTLRGRAVVSQHLGNLFSAEGALLLERTARDLLDLFDARPEIVACDIHPDYVSTRFAERLAAELDVPLERVQHHHAHVAACAAEHGIDGPVLGLAWDGSGLGTDGTLWGGEALLVDGARFERIAHVRPFSLPGGERAAREPRRSALGLLFEVFGRRAAERVARMFAPAELPVLTRMLERGVGCPRTSGMGRLFDAVSALAGIRTLAGFEGQAAMELEFAAGESDDDGSGYPVSLGTGHPAVADWEPLARALLADLDRGAGPSLVAARFHDALVDLAELMATRAGARRVVLTGGCFQNLRLARGIHERLVGRGFEVFLPLNFPPNDGGLSLGQAYAASMRRRAHVPRDSR